MLSMGKSDARNRGIAATAKFTGFQVEMAAIRRHTASNAANNSAFEAPTASRRAMTTISSGGSSETRRRKDSRTRRLIRFLSTARRTFLRAIASPRRQRPAFEGRASTVK